MASSNSNNSNPIKSQIPTNLDRAMIELLIKSLRRVFVNLIISTQNILELELRDMVNTRVNIEVLLNFENLVENNVEEIYPNPFN